MTLTTHAIAGAALATLMPTHPVLGFVAGFTSHFVLDSIPHWTYSVDSIKRDKKDPMNTSMLVNKGFLLDFLKISADGILGLLLSILFFVVYFQDSFWIVLLGDVAGMLPDALQFVYWKWKPKILIPLQHLHILIHSKIRLDDKPVLGIFSQIAIIILIILIFK